eukprot:COSAG04_NODE_17256_length_474_cov_1.002667_1_plen_39_part_01
MFALSACCESEVDMATSEMRKKQIGVTAKMKIVPARAPP